MSEYQYHEYQAVDMVLTPEEQAAVDDLSSHIEVSSIWAVVTYDWSDFRPTHPANSRPAPKTTRASPGCLLNRIPGMGRD